MITRIAMIDGLDHTFIKPIVNKVRDDISYKIIQDPDAYNYNKGNYDKEGVTVDDNVADNTISGPNLYYTYEVEEDEGMSLGTSTYNPLNKIILYDKDTKLGIRPNYKQVNITLTLTYQTRSRTFAQRVINRLKTYYDTSGYTMVHSLPYSYLLPNNILTLINDIKELKDPSMTLEEYINSICLYQLDYTVNHGNNRRVPVFNGVFVNIFGSFETNPAEIELEKMDNESYSVEFTYKITVKEPISLTVQYPIIVNNKKLPDIWIPDKSVAKPVDNAENIISIANIIGDYKSMKNNQHAMVHVPSYDNFYPLLYDDNSMLRLVCILLEVDVTTPNFIFNVKDLKYIGLQELFINYLLKCDETELFLFSHSLIHIELYDGNDKKDYGLYKDDDGNIKTTKPLLSTGSYHLVINVVIDKAFINYYSQTYSDSRKIIRDQEIIQVYKFPMKDIGRNILPTKIQ